MKDKVFIDTNILIYFYSSDELGKRNSVEKILNHHENIIISTQVINEFINVMHKKRNLKFNVINSAAQEISEVFFISLINISTIKLALLLTEKYKYSYYDTLIIASSLENGCNILFSEDMQNNQNIDSLKIVNPLIKP